MLDRATRRRLAAIGILAAAALLWGAPLGLAAEDEPDGTFEIRARLEPPTLRPGDAGLLVIETAIGDHLHVYATDAAGDGVRLAWRPVEAAGVTYDVPARELTWEQWRENPGEVTWTAPTPYADPNVPELDPYPVWQEGHDFVLKIPVRLDAAVAPGTTIGVEVDYNACDAFMCYTPVKKQRALVVVAAGAAAGGSDGAPRIGDPAGDKSVQVTLTIDEEASEAVVTFAPTFGYYLYMPGSMEGIAIEVDPLPDAGISWGDVAYEDEGGKIRDPFEVRIPFERDDAQRLRIRVAWQACLDAGQCLAPDEGELEARWKAAPIEVAPPMIDPGAGDGDPAAAEAFVPGDVRFPVVEGGDIGGTAAPAEGGLEKAWKKSWLLFLGGVFLAGLGLAFTPCVLPIIPLTISVIGGGAAGKVSRGRLTTMLTVYVLGLSLTYGVAGAVSGSLGKAIDVEAAFRIPVVVYALAAFFIVLAAGMLGIFEMQPPAWMEKIRGGAAQKSGTLLGSFLLGCVAALIASPCTGPFVVGLLTFVATTGNPALGFLLFFTLGLGMGAVFFAAGSLNLLAKPGPWMVWVRYVFGILLFGVALYFLGAYAGLTSIPLFAVGFALAFLTWWLVVRHLVKHEGERPGVAQKRGAGVAVAIALVTGVVAHLTYVPASTLDWIKLKDVDHLEQEVARATSEGRPVLVDVWATWCHYCKEYDKVMERDDELRTALSEFVLLKVDETDDSRPDLRTAVGLPLKGQPVMAFLDREGRIHRAADVERWYGKKGEDPAVELKRRIEHVEGAAISESARQ